MRRVGSAPPTNWQLTVAGWCFSTTLGIVGIAVSVSNRSQASLLTVLSLALGAAAFLFFITSLVRTLSLIRRLPLGSRSMSLQVGVHSQRWAESQRDVADAHEFFATLIPRDPPSRDLMLALFAHTPHSIRLIESKRGGRVEIVGMYVVAPLNKRGVADFKARAILALNAGLLDRCVPRTWRRPRGVYIGGVAGSTSAGRAWALSSLESFVDQLGVSCVIARPVSPDGIRVMRSAQFLEVGGGSPFWYRDLSAADPGSGSTSQRLDKQPLA